MTDQFISHKGYTWVKRTCQYKGVALQQTGARMRMFLGDHRGDGELFSDPELAACLNKSLTEMIIHLKLC